MMVVGAMFAFNGAIFVLFVRWLTTDFGGWLRWRRRATRLQGRIRLGFCWST